MSIRKSPRPAETTGKPTGIRGTTRAATEHLVKFTALSFAYDVRKIFFHAGTCGPINGPDAGGVLFEYGGTLRRCTPAPRP